MQEIFVVKLLYEEREKMKIKRLVKRYYPLVMLLIFAATMLWGIATTVAKSPTLASTLLHPDTLKIVQLTDVHYSSHGTNKGARMRACSGALLQDAVCQINAMPDVDVVVFSGDSIDTPDKQNLIEFAKIANNLKYPWYNALGNHEAGVCGGLSKEKYFQVLSSINLNYSTFAFLKPYYVITPKKDYKVIFLDGVIDSKISANGYFSAEQLAWFDKKLTDYSDKKVIVVQHFPVVEPIKSPSHKILNDAEYLKVLDKHHNVVAVLAGHYHCPRVVKRNGVVHVATSALVQYPNAFRVITIYEEPTGTKVKIETVETNLKDVQAQSKAALGAKAKYVAVTPKNSTFILCCP